MGRKTGDVIKIKKIQLTAVTLAVCITMLAWGDALYAISVIPGAKGFGLETPAGRGGKIIHVTNLNSSGVGSFRAAIEASGPRIVIFDVSGTIVYNNRYKIKQPYITIAGQTAPSPGITLKGSTLTVDTHDVLIQHIRVRTGDEPDGVSPDYRDAISIGLTQPPEGLYNIVIDHCSASWSIDETVAAGGCSNVTFSNCIISEPLNDSLHSKGLHSKAMIIAGEAERIAIIDNLMAHSVDRNPYINDGRNSVVIANNLIYNPKVFNIIFQIWTENGMFSVVGNVVKPGKNTGRYAANQLPTFWKDFAHGTKLYLYGNKTQLTSQTDENDWTIVREVLDEHTLESAENAFKVTKPPIWIDNYSAKPFFEVEEYIINNAGARPADRDAVDIRIINDVIHGSGGIIDSPKDVGGWPYLKENKVTHELPSNPNGDSDNDGYTNIEEWLHDKVREVEKSISTPKELKIK